MMTKQEALEVIRQRDYCETHLIPKVAYDRRHMEYVGPKYCPRCQAEQECADARELKEALEVLRDNP